MIHGIDLKWWLALIALGGFTLVMGGAVLDSVPWATAGGVVIGWAFGCYTMRKAAQRALAMLRGERRP